MIHSVVMPEIDGILFYTVGRNNSINPVAGYGPNGLITKDAATGLIHPKYNIALINGFDTAKKLLREHGNRLDLADACCAFKIGESILTISQDKTDTTMNLYDQYHGKRVVCTFKNDDRTLLDMIPPTLVESITYQGLTVTNGGLVSFFAEESEKDPFKTAVTCSAAGWKLIFEISKELKRLIGQLG